jgi:hypothetical protein
MTTTALAGTTVNFNINIHSNGTASGAYSSVNLIAYDSSAIAGRICFPSTNTLQNAFKDTASSFSSAQSGDLGNFILDVKNVLYL